MKQTIPLTQDLVLIGGGHTHALVLRKWGMKPLPGVRLTLINPGPTAPYSGMLPGFVAGHYTRDDLDIDLVKLARFAGARLIVGRAVALDPDAKLIEVEGRGPVAFDVASVDVGITSEMPSLKGFADHGTPAKPLGPFAATWEAFVNDTTDPSVAIIGGGVAGAELSMAKAHALRQRGHDPRVTLIDRGRVLEDFRVQVRKRLLDALAGQGVRLREDADVVRLSAGTVHFAEGEDLPAAFITGAAGALPQAWMAQTGLETHEGFLTVGPTLQTSDPDIFAVGDCAHLSHAPRPKAGVFAVREAPVLYDNLVAHLSGGRMRAYRPQRDYLKLISLGKKAALAEKTGTAMSGPLLWKWKDRIDRKFMDQFRDITPMKAEPPLRVARGAQDMLKDGPACMGCGAKVGSGALSGALAGLPETRRDDVLSRPGDDAAILKSGRQKQVISVDHLSAVTEDPALMAQIATIHALGDVWSMGAAPQAALLSLILPRMSEPLQARTLAEITKAAVEVLAEAGAEIIGGHTTQGDTLTIGLTVTGLTGKAPITVGGASPGDVLLLTKPIGSGTILAAEMRGQARGQDVLACLTRMIQPQAEASRLLAKAKAMTDVTGFGLAGHLSAICRASGTGAELYAQDVPLMPGALALAEAGVRSTLFADNVKGALPVNGNEGPVKDLLFDPQTCGGLLAAVPEKDAEAILKSLIGAGYEAARIGRVTDGAGISLL